MNRGLITVRICYWYCRYVAAWRRPERRRLPGNDWDRHVPYVQHCSLIARPLTHRRHWLYSFIATANSRESLNYVGLLFNKNKKINNCKRRSFSPYFATLKFLIYASVCRSSTTAGKLFTKKNADHSVTSLIEGGESERELTSALHPTRLCALRHTVAAEFNKVGLRLEPLLWLFTPQIK